MSKYTTELRYIIDNEKLIPPTANSLSLKSVLDSYDIYNVEYEDITTGIKYNRRDELNQRILEHYYFREIGFETVPRFLFALKRKLNEIMPYYNQMYKSSDIKFNPLYNIELTETYTHNIKGNGTTAANGKNKSTSKNTAENIGVENDTPQVELTEEDIKGNKYASRVGHETNTNENTDETENSSAINVTDTKDESYTRKTEGSSAGLSFSHAIRQWREVMINVDMMIVDELKNLFMNVY